MAKAYNQKNPIRRYCFRIIQNSISEIIIVICILLNTISLSLDKYPRILIFILLANEGLVTISEYINFVLTIVFMVELILKLVGMGPILYCRDAFNIFDAIIVGISIVELSISPPSFISKTGNTNSSGISALRTLRLFRLFKLARSWKSLQNLLRTLGKSVEDIINFLVLLIIYMFVEALIGMNFFANQFRFDAVTGYKIKLDDPAYGSGVIPRCNYEGFYYSFETVFQYLAIDNYNLVMYDQRRGTGWVSELYSINLIVIGNWMLLNLFLAILLGNFDGNNDFTESNSMKAYIIPYNRFNSLKTFFSFIPKYFKCCFRSSKISPDESTSSLSAPTRHCSSAYSANSIERANSNIPDIPTSPNQFVKHLSTLSVNPKGLLKENKYGKGKRHSISGEVNKEPSVINQLNSGKNVGTLSKSSSVSEDIQLTPNAKKMKEYKSLKTMTIKAFEKKKKLGTQKSVECKSARKTFSQRSLLTTSEGSVSSMDSSSFDNYFIPNVTVTDERDKAITGNAFFILSPENRFRVFIAKIVQNKYFDNFILLLIFFSSVTLAIDNPLYDPNGKFVKTLKTIDFVVTGIFTLEMVLKMITYNYL